MVCDFWLFIYLFEILKQIVFIFCLPFLFSENTFLGNTIFFALLCFQFVRVLFSLAHRPKDPGPNSCSFGGLGLVHRS